MNFLTLTLGLTLALLNTLPTTSWAADPASAPGGFCHVNSDGRVQIADHFFGLKDGQAESLQALLAELDKIRLENIFLAEEVIQLPSPLVKTGRMAKDERSQTLNALPAKLTKALNELPATRRSLGMVFVSNYFEAADADNFYQFMTAPKKASLKTAQTKHRLRLTAQTMRKVFPIGNPLPVNVVAHRYLVSGKAYYELRLSGQRIYEQMVHAAAKAKQMEISEENYMETIRCGLGRVLLGKIFYHQFMLEDDEPNFNIDLDSQFCLDSSAQEFVTMARDNTLLNNENLLRGHLSTQLPNLSIEFGEATSPTYIDKIKGYLDLSLAYSAPATLTVINNILPQEVPQLTAEELELIRSDINTGVEAGFSEFSFLSGFREVLLGEKIIDQVMAIYSDCQFRLVDDKGNPMSREDVVLMLQRLDDFLFLRNLGAAINTVYDQVSTFNQQELESLLKDYIYNVRMLTSYQTLQSVGKLYALPIAPDNQDLSVLFDIVLSEQLAARLDERADQSAFDAGIQSLAANFLKTRTDNTLKETLRTAYAADVLTAAKRVMDFKEGLTDNELPYDFPAILRVLEPQVKQLSPDILNRINIVTNHYATGGYRDIWPFMKERINRNLEATKSNCDEVGTLSNIGYWFKSWLPGDKSEQHKNARMDCNIVGLLGAALALDDNQHPENMGRVLSNLREHYSDGELETFVELYREEIAGEIIGEYRVLDMKDPQGGWGKPLLYESLAKVTEPKEAIARVFPAARKASQKAHEHLRTVHLAKTPEDLKFFITRTRVINQLFGENRIAQKNAELSGFLPLTGVDVMSAVTGDFVFRRLALKHKTLQNDWVLDERLNEEIWDEFVHNQIRLSLGILGLQFARWGTGFLPQMTGGPYVSGLIGVVENKIHYLSEGVGNAVWLLIASHIPILVDRKIGYNKELRQLREIMHTDAISSVTADNPLPMVDWRTYQRQQKMYAGLNKHANTMLIWDGAFTVLPFIMTGGGQLLRGKVTNPLARYWGRQLRDVPQGRPARFYKAMMRSRVKREFIRMQFDLKALGINRSSYSNPNVRSINYLRGQLNSIRSNPSSTARQIAAAEEAYENIVFSVGNRLMGWEQQPEILREYSRALIGPSGSIDDLAEFVSEYERLLLQPGWVL